MQFKSLFFLVSAVVSVLAASSVSELTASVSKIDSQVAILQNGITTFPATGATYKDAYEVHNSVDAVADAVEVAVTIARGFDGPVSATDGTKILNSFHQMVPVIKGALNALVEKKDALLAVKVGQIKSIVILDLQVLRKAVVDLQTDLIAIAPPECVAEAKDLANDIVTSLDAAINVFATA